VLWLRSGTALPLSTRIGSEFPLQDLNSVFALRVNSMYFFIILVSGLVFVSYFVLKLRVTCQCCKCRFYFKCSMFNVILALTA
jgi:hypothetical protein